MSRKRNVVDAGTRIAELVNKLNRLDKVYREGGKPLVSDIKYDALYAELVKLEKANPHLVQADSPTQRAGGGLDSVPKEKRVKHKVKMLSLDNATSLEDIAKFSKRCQGLLQVGLEPKIDGLSVDLQYLDGRLACASTGGDGSEGEDVTYIVSAIECIPKRIDYVGELHIRGEVFVKCSVFNHLNETLVKAGQTPYANERNLAAGIVRGGDRLRAGTLLSFMAYGVVGRDSEATHHIQELAFALLMGFPTVVPHPLQTSDSKGIYNRCLELEQSLRQEDIPVDGVVIKIDSLEHRRKLGENRHSVNWGIAFKFRDRAVETVVNGIEESVGGSGQITPIALIEPVRVDGAMLSRVNLHNHGLHLGLAKGDVVSVVRKAGVSPYIAGVVKRSGGKGLEYPKHCPECKAEVRLNISKIATTAFCDNTECPAKVISRLNHYVSRKALDVQGIAEDLIGKLHNQGRLLDVADLYSLQDFNLFEVGVGKVRAEKILREIQRSMYAPMHRFIYGLSIPTIGSAAAEELAHWLKDKELDLMARINYLEATDLKLTDKQKQALKVWLETPSNYKLLTRLYLKVSPS